MDETLENLHFCRRQPWLALTYSNSQKLLRKEGHQE